MTIFTQAIYGIYLSALLVVLLFVAWSKREEPQEATFWLLVVALLPGVGVVLLLFFGITRVERQDFLIRSTREAMAGRAGKQLAEMLTEKQRALNQFMLPQERANTVVHHTFDRIFPQALLLDGNHVELLCDGDRVYPRMLQDIRQATQSIQLQSYILMNDAMGFKLLKALEKKAAQGVDVKVLVDSIGSFQAVWSPRFRHLLFSHNSHLQLHAFSKLNLLAPWRFQLRNHRKLLVVDQKIVYSGGINISQENSRMVKLPPNRYIHDLHCRITGPAVAEFALSFWRDWSHTTGENFLELAGNCPAPAPQNCGNSALRVIASGPGDHYQGTREFFFAAAALASRSLVIITPYLVPGKDYIDALTLAASRGVEVKIIVPQRNNHFYVDWAARNFYPELLRKGVRIFEKHGRFSHTKALLVDNEWGIMGSSNCDSRSFRLNFELDFCFEGGKIIADMNRQIEQELAESAELSLFECDQWPSWQRLLCGICALLNPIL